MGKISISQCKQCRREGKKLFLKSDKCFSPKCTILKKKYLPGVHGPTSRTKLTGYGTQLREKQKAKRIYGLNEKQFRNYFEKSMQKRGDTGAFLTGLLETRLDNVVFQLGFAKSRQQARQLVAHAHFLVNKKRVNIPSYQTKVGETIEIRDKSKGKGFFKDLEETLTKRQTPTWLSVDPKTGTGKIVSLPKAEDLNQNFDPKLIVEFYSR